MGQRGPQFDYGSGAVLSEYGDHENICPFKSMVDGLANRRDESPESRHVFRRQHHRRQPAIRLAESRKRNAEAALQPAGELLMRRTLRAALLAVLATSSASGRPRTRLAQQPVFRTETRLIVETVTVKDKEGRAIEGLTAKDFAITEDGEPQQIAFVEFQRLAPIAPSAPNAPNAPNAPSAPVAAGTLVQTQ